MRWRSGRLEADHSASESISPNSGVVPYLASRCWFPRRRANRCRIVLNAESSER